MRKLFLITVSTLLIVTVHAQLLDRNCRPEDSSLSFGSQLGLPSADFDSSIGNALIGFGGSFHNDSRFRSFQPGVNFSYAKFGSFADDISLYQGENSNGTAVFEDANVDVKHKVYRTHTSLRFNPFHGKIQPYIEGLAGVKWYSSSAKISQYIGRSKETLDKYNLERSLTTSFGWAAGAKIEVTRGLFIEGRYEQLNGGTASFIDPETFSMTSNEVFDYETSRSKTNISQIHIGVSLEFRSKCRNNTNHRGNNTHKRFQ